MSLRLRLTLWYSGILAVTLLAFGIGVYFFQYISTYKNIQDNLRLQSQKVESRIQLQRLGPAGLGLILNQRDALGATNMFLQVVNFTNGTISRSANMEAYDLKLPFDEKKIQDKLAYYEAFTIQGVHMLQYSKLLTLPQGETVGVLIVATIVDQQVQTLQELRLTLALTSLLAVVVAASIGWFLARKALKPIDQVIDAASQIERGTDLAKRIEYNGNDEEILNLTRTINGMLERIEIIYKELETAYGAQRRFVSDASHELRTPLTTIRGNVDLLEKMWKQTPGHTQLSELETREISLEAMQDIASESERMTRLINDMLSLARADSGFQIHREPVELKPLVEEVARRAQFLPRTAEWHTGDFELLEGIRINGNRDYLQQLLFIFIENAFKYTAEGSVTLEAVLTADQVGLVIKDTGIGMDKEEVPRIFDRFYRADVSRGQTSGTGLGLSIAKWIIDEHGGSIEVVTRKGEGSKFVIWLPLGFPPSLQ